MVHSNAKPAMECSNNWQTSEPKRLQSKEDKAHTPGNKWLRTEFPEKHFSCNSGWILDVKNVVLGKSILSEFSIRQSK